LNTSELGQSLVFTESGGSADATVVRAPKRIYGVETTLDWQPSRNWQLGGSLSFQEGEFDSDDDGDFLALGSQEIAPLTVRAYLENQTTPGWSNRLQLIYVGNRDRAFEDDVDPVAIDGYIVVDLVSEVQLWGGTLSIGVGNLFDNEYRTTPRQFSTEFTEEANEAVFARGRTLSINFSREF